MHRNPIHRSLLALVLTGVLAASAQAQTLVVNPVTGKGYSGTASYVVANVAATDTVNGAQATLGKGGNAVVSQFGSWPTGFTLGAGGAIAMTASVSPGTYTSTYQLCASSAPTDCGTAGVTITVGWQVVANPDSGSAPAGIASTAIANVAANDTINSQPAVLGSGGNATIALVTSPAAGISLNTATGAVTTSTSIGPGMYTFEYQVCDLQSTPKCASATDTVTITASIIANADTGNAVAGTPSTPIANVAANDTINGLQAVLGSGGNATIATIGSLPAGITLNLGTGAVTTAASLGPGTYAFQYQLCDLNSPPDCATPTTDSVIVAASIIATVQNGTAPAGATFTPIANVAANDSVNGFPVVLGSGGNATIAQSGTWQSGITLNTATGAISTSPGVPVGTYGLQYQLCDLYSPPDCAYATDQVTVTVSIIASAVSGTFVAGLAGTPIANVAASDTINGAAAVLGASGNALVSEVGSWQTGIALNTATGAVTTTNTLAAGTYNLQYQLCDLSADCASAGVIISNAAPSIVVNPVSGTADLGSASIAIANVAINDTVNGAPAVVGPGGNATVAKGTPWPSALGLNTTNGNVDTFVSTPAGTYSFPYTLCDLNTPPDCNTNGTGTVTVSQAIITAAVQTGTADVGIASTAIANIAAGGIVDGNPAVLGAGGNAAVTPYGTWQAGISLNLGTGAVTTTASVPLGTYSLQYKLCDDNFPRTCSSPATDTVYVIPAGIVANSFTGGTADFGIGSQVVANVTAGDTVNGGNAVVLGSTGNASISKYGTWPSGLALNPTSGAVNTSTTLPVGPYSVQYQLCDNNLPAGSNCADGGVQFTVNALPVIVVNPQTGGECANGVPSVCVANVTQGDTINGAGVVLGANAAVQVTTGMSWPAGFALNPINGQITTNGSPAVGTYSLPYQICDLNNPPYCPTGNIATLTVVPGAVVANAMTGTADSGIASLPIANVALTDTINGAPAVLGAGGNAVVYKVGTWSNGIGLSPTGAVSTQISSADGIWTNYYVICNLLTPQTCSSPSTGAAVTVTIITASIIANPVSIVAPAGATAQPVGNVLLTDLVNGAFPVTGTGPGANSHVAEVGTWPTGVALNNATGGVSTASTLAAGNYQFQYQLCDLNVPVNCSVNFVDLDVENKLIVNAQTATVALGVNSTPLKNVVNGQPPNQPDTLNGVACRLQTSPNCAVSPSGTWPTGIALNTTTGAVTVASTVAQGYYDSMYYTVCPYGSTADCQSAPVTIQVDQSITAVSVAGSIVVGNTGGAIGNVVINDVINGAQATLGSSGNATVKQVGTWPSGISLNTTTGVITVAATVPAGTYGGINGDLEFSVCDKITPITCVDAYATVSVTQAFNEVSVSPYMTGDIEFDWARDGRFCSTCNFGSTNSQVNWTDRDNNLWVNYVDQVTGMFNPTSGRETNVVSLLAFFWQDWGNGPEWAFSTPVAGQDPVSQLVYTGIATGEPATYEYAGAALAWETGNSGGTATWAYNFFPGAYAPPKNNTVLPLASQCVSDSFASAVFENLLTPTDMYTETVSTAVGTQPFETPFGALANGIGERFVACGHDANSPYPQSTRWLTFQGDVNIGDNVLQQEFWYDMDNPTAAYQLTFDPTTKQRGVMFLAPDFPDPVTGNATYILMTVAADMQIEVFQQMGTNANGSPIMTLVNTIYSPDPAEPYMFDPKAFVNCTPQCVTYVVMGLGTVAESQQTETEPNGLGVTTLNPKNPFFEVLAAANNTQATGAIAQRLDPKVFITDAGPVVYYDLLNTATATVPYNDQGIWMINMGLGQPQGNCVGWSAYDGPNPTFNANNPAPNYCTQPTSNYPIN
jgi:hypothetical protein